AGGAGHQNDNWAGTGADGGGIVIIDAQTIVGNSYSIIANGQEGVDAANNDGSGGGGAGGSILINSSISGSLTIEAKGGKGGDNFTSHGPGGGAGGGIIYTTSSLSGSISTDVSGGVSGLAGSDPRGAEPGNDGQVLSGLDLVVSDEPIGEICDNGIDDDCDGYTDCYDTDCSGNPECEFVNQPLPSCQFVPEPQTFEMQQLWQTAQTMDARQTPNVGDIDGDGVPEVIAKHHNTANTLYVFNGATGALETQITSPRSDTFVDATAIGDTDLDGFGEIFFVSDDAAPSGSDRYLFCYEHDGTLKWQSAIQVGHSTNDDRTPPMLADFDQDGTPEVLLGNQIFSSVTGVLLADGTTSRNSGGHVASFNEKFPVAVDILPDNACADCSGLEIVVGDEILAVDLTESTPTDAISLALSFPYSSHGIQRRGWSSVADMDQDGDLDVVVINRGNSTFGNRAVVYIWDGQTNALIGGPYQVDTCTAGTSLQGSVANTTCGGHPNIADFNGDGTMEIGLAGKQFYVVMDYNSSSQVISELWSKTSTDGSERTGSSVFDFEGDGINEVIYRDETTLYIFNGADGAEKAAIGCTSGTRTEYPLVADVTGDGETNICVTCNNRVKVFGALSTPWVAARSVWNQHNYFVVNVNDDLTIPQTQQNHAAGFPITSPENYPFNNFLTQITVLGTDGLPIYEAQDVAISNMTIGEGDCGSENDI
ncbi:MAG: VCBS repeat-containing protein, partial [Bacteroidota bacterium]